MSNIIDCCCSKSRLAELQLKGLDDREESWTDIESINRVFCFKRTDISGTFMNGDFKRKEKMMLFIKSNFKI